MKLPYVQKINTRWTLKVGRELDADIQDKELLGIVTSISFSAFASAQDRSPGNTL